MGRSSGYFCLLLICSWYQSCMANPFAIAFEVGEKAVALYEVAKGIKQGFEPEAFEASNNQIYEELRELRSDFNDFKTEIMGKISRDFQTKIRVASDKFFGHVKNVHSKYEEFLEYSGSSPGQFEDTTIHDFANNSVKSSLVELRRVIEQMQEAFIDQDIEGHNLISIIARNSTANDLMCVRGESKQQLINDLHQVFIKSSIKGLMVVLYSYEVKAKYEHRKYQGERQSAIKLFTNSTNIVSGLVRDALKISSREVWRCDPHVYRPGVTYDKLQEVFQAYVLRETDTKRLSSWGQSNVLQQVEQEIALGTNKCSDMGDERLACISTTCRDQPSEKRCNGHIRNCQNMPSSQICHAPKGSDRRYDWLRTDKNNNFAHWGRNRFHSNCGRTQDITNGFFHPDTCICTCESEHILDDRHFSLHSVLSDVKENKVVTGVQLVKEYHVYQIQIEQGTLGPNGTIIDKPEWKNYKNFTRADLYDPKVAVPKMAEHWNPHYEYEESVEFHKNDVVYTVKHGRNQVYLDTLDAAPERVVTGLRFQHAGESLKLEIQTTAFNYDTGELKLDTSSWKSNGNNTMEREELRLNKPDDPTRVYGPSTVLSNHNQFVDFQITDLDHDFGQYTVPFLDLQNVTTTVRMPLSGAGIVLRGQKNSGGFLALKVIHYDYTNHL